MGSTIGRKQSLGLRSLALGAVLVLGLCGPLLGAPGAKPEAPSARPMIAERLGQVEGEIASLILKRQGVEGFALARVELGIDVRLVLRSALAAAAGAKPETDQQAAAWLRALTLADAVPVIEGSLNALAITGTPLNQAQNDAIEKLHQATFTLNDGASLKQLDESARLVAGVLAELAGVDLKTLSALRPRPVAVAPNWLTTQERPAAQLIDEARRLNVSPVLRGQLVLLAKQAQEAAARGEAGSTAVLSQAIDLGRALQDNIAVSPEFRVQLENRVTEALALYTDPRTRSAGQNRLSGLNQYRQVVARVSKLQLKESMRQHLGPVFAWAQSSPGEGGKALAAVEAFVQARAQYEGRTRPDGVSSFTKAAEDLDKRVDAASSAFLAAAANLPKGSASLADLEKHSAETRQAVSLLGYMDNMPKTLDVMGAYKPKPFGAIERRAALAATALVAANTPAAKVAEAAKFLEDLSKLAELIDQLGKLQVDDLRGESVRTYTGSDVATLQGKYKSLAGALVQAIADGAEIDAAQVGRLVFARNLLSALAEAAKVDTTLLNLAPLSRWVDLRLNPDDLRALVAPYAAAMTEAAAGLLKDTAGAPEKWAKACEHFRPLVKFVQQLGLYREQCISFRSGTAGVAAALLSPLDTPTFATERQVALAAALHNWFAARGEAASANQVIEALSRRLPK